MHVEWYGQSAFRLESEGITVFIDPFGDMSAARDRGMRWDYPPIEGVEADLLLVTGPVSRNMELALLRTHDATPAPKLVVAVGDCGCDGGIFGASYATRGAVSSVLGVDVAVPGCPPPPIDILRGILTAVRRGRPAAPAPSPAD